MSAASETATVFSIVLAAGSASRFGSAKQLARYRDQPLVARVQRVAEGACGARSLLVTGSGGAEVHAAAAPLSGFRVHNSEYRDGLASSIRCAVAAVAGCADAVLLLLADQPLVDAVHVAALIDAWDRNRDCIVATEYSGTRGVPAVFPHAAFGALQALRGDRGAQRLLQSGAFRCHGIPSSAASVDVDRPADLERLNREF